MKSRRGTGPGDGGTVERLKGGTASAASRNAHTAEAAVCRAAHLIARHEYLLVAARHAGVMLYDSSLKHVSISPLVASYYVEPQREATGMCADDRAAWPDDRVVSPMLQAVASTRRDRGATRSWRAASDQHRASRVTHHRGHGICRHDHADAAAANTRSHPADRRSARTNRRSCTYRHATRRRCSGRCTAPLPRWQLRIPAHAARPAPCASWPSSVHPRTRDRTGATG